MADSKNSWVAVLTAVTALIGPLAGFGGTATEDHRAAERHFWDQQIRVGKRLNWITGVASAAGVLGLIFVGLGLRESRYATVASNRGWLATEQATLAYPLALNEPIEYKGGVSTTELSKHQQSPKMGSLILTMFICLTTKLAITSTPPIPMTLFIPVMMGAEIFIRLNQKNYW